MSIVIPPRGARWSASLLAATLLAALAAGPAAAAEQEKAPYGGELEIRTPLGQPLSDGERERIVAAILARPRVAREVGDQRVRAVRVTLDSAVVDKAAEPSDELVAHAVIFNYATGRATRYTLSLATGEVVEARELRGRPQASPEEFAEASELLRGDDRLASLLEREAVVEGGFIVDPPESAEKRDPRHRYLQLQLLSRDREEIHYFVTVDLTDRTLVEVRPPSWRSDDEEK